MEIPNRYREQQKDNWIQLLAFGVDEDGVTFTDVLKEINKPRKDRRQTNPGEILRD